MNICYKKKRERMTMKNRAYVSLPFTNKSGLHCKVKGIFFLMCQIKMYWLNVSNSFFLFKSKCNVSRWRTRGVLLLLLFEWRSKVVTPDYPTLPLFYIIVYGVDFVLVLKTTSIMYIHSTRGNFKMWPLWAVVRYVQVKIISNVP
jgi:hypothetical protein